MNANDYYVRKQVRENYEARVKAVKDEFKKLQDEAIANIGECPYSESDIEDMRQEVIAKYGVGKFEEDGLSLQITTQDGWELIDSNATVVSLIKYYQEQDLTNALDALTISKSNLNKFCAWLQPLNKEVYGVKKVPIYKVTVKEVK